VTEREWLDCTNPIPMLHFLAGTPSRRKLRLFGCACARRVWRWLTDVRSQRAAEVAERFADGAATERELDDAHEAAAHAAAEAQARFNAASQGWAATWAAHAEWAAAIAAEDAAGADHGAEAAEAAASWYDDLAPDVTWPVYRAQEAARDAARAAGINDARAWAAADAVERDHQAALLRDIFRPFRPATVDSAWLRWNDGAVAKIAHGIYTDRTFDLLPILADALEEAGCTDPAILDHCRQPGEHVRGWWVVDLILGKE